MSHHQKLAKIFGEPFASSKEIKGAVDHADRAEVEHLWEGFQKMTPAWHIDWLRHFIALELHLSRLQAGWIPATPCLEWRLHLPYFFYEDMQHVKELRARLEEFSKAATKFELAPQTNAFLAAIAPAESASSFFGMVFAEIKPAILQAYRDYLGRCDEIIDGPTVYTLKRILYEKERQIEAARAFVRAYPLPSPDAEEAARYKDHVRASLQAIGSLSPCFYVGAAFAECPVRRPAGPSPEKELHDPRLRLVEHFPSTREECPVHGTLREIIYHNATEWQVIGPMCYAFHELREMPLDFFIDFSRHIWDECRHARMGFRRLEELGCKREEFLWPSVKNKPASLLEYVAMLTLVGEACSFKRKRGSIVPFLRAGDQKSAILPTIDCVDEQLHVSYGNRWVPEIFKRYRNDDRPFAEIARETRLRVMEEIKMLPADAESARQLSGNLPLFCSALEFADLDFSSY